jgi:arginine/lysine/ornithine decarboxylase
MMQRRLLKAVQALTGPGTRRFYMPGHKGRLLSELDWNRLDITEIPGADNLHAPAGPLAELQAELARCYGADHTAVLVGGSTLGLQAALMAALAPGEAVLIPTNAHRAVYGGLALARGRGIYFAPEMDPLWGFGTHVAPETVARQCEAHPEAVGLVLTNPTYYGTTSDVGAIARELHRRGKWLIVDEAHGAHLRFCAALPDDALSQGADVVVQSAHKTLAAFTQTGMLHQRGGRISWQGITRMLDLLETSSPSYPLMLSVEAGVADAEARGETVMTAIARAWDAAASGEKPGDVLRLYRPQSGLPYDKSKWLYTAAGGRGRLAEESLRARGLTCEFATADLVLAYLGMGTADNDLAALTGAVTEINRGLEHGENGSASPVPAIFGDPDYHCVVALEDAFRADDCRVRAEDLAERVAADFITPYPPGIPAVLPGGRIAPDMAEALAAAWRRGETILGLDDAGRAAVIK